jgi:hypothetical protein
MPAKAGIQNHLKILDYRLHGNDVKEVLRLFTKPSRLKVRGSVIKKPLTKLSQKVAGYHLK